MTPRLAEPQTWQELQVFVRDLWRESGLSADVNIKLTLPRGSVNVDVRAQDTSSSPNLLLLAECKHWRARVPKAVVHSFRTVVAETGAHVGFVIAKLGFQRGAAEAARNTNIHLVTWPEFQQHYAERWLAHQESTLAECGQDLRNYCDPLEDYIADRLRRDGSLRGAWLALAEEYVPVSMAAHPRNLRPLVNAGAWREKLGIEAPDAWTFAAWLRKRVAEGLQSFDAIFGEAWRYR